MPDTEEGSRLVQLRSGGYEVMVSSRVVLNASGLGGVNAGEMSGKQSKSKIGAGVLLDGVRQHYEPGVIHMACGRAGYVGLVRVEDERLDIAAAMDPAAMRIAGGPGALATEILREARLPTIPDLERAPWKGTPLLTRTNRRLRERRMFVIGDAAGYVEPFTGEGMAWAMAGARAVVPLVQRCLANPEANPGDIWDQIWYHQVVRQQRVCRMAAGVLRRPMLIGLAVRLLSMMPALARPVFRRMYRV